MTTKTKTRAAAKSKDKDKAPAPVQPKHEPEALGKVSSLDIPIHLLLAAARCTDPSQGAALHRSHVYLHAFDGKPAIAGTDGQRLFVGTWPLEDKKTLPDWLEAGVLIPADGLGARLGLVFSAGGMMARATFGGKRKHLSLSDAHDEPVCSFRIDVPMDQRWIDYRPFIDSISVLAAEDPQPVAYDAKMMRTIGEIATILHVSRMPGGASGPLMVHGGSAEAPVLVTFPGWDGTLMIVAPLRNANRRLGALTAALLQPAIVLQINKLDAEAVYLENYAKTLHPTDPEKAYFEGEAARVRAKIENLQKPEPVVQLPSDWKRPTIKARHQEVKVLPSPEAAKPKAKGRDKAKQPPAPPAPVVETKITATVEPKKTEQPAKAPEGLKPPAPSKKRLSIAEMVENQRQFDLAQAEKKPTIN